MSDIRVMNSGELVCGEMTYRCVIGRDGLVPAEKKTEGDWKTPLGCYELRRVFYRADRLEAPETRLPVQKINEDDVWCDDQSDVCYNTLRQLPHKGSHERLWRDDEVYDVVVEIGYNDDPPVPGRGSAIFMHVARASYSPTAGCVALALPDLLAVLREMSSGSKICITAGQTEVLR